MSTRARAAQVVVAILVLAGIGGAATRVAADAPPGRYTFPEAGTVFDTKTKLTWQQAVPAPSYTWADAKSYCASVALQGAGWRLPSMKELQTIVDESKLNPAIDATAFPGTPVDHFWTSSPLAGSPSYAWYVYFGYGYTYSDHVSNT